MFVTVIFFFFYCKTCKNKFTKKTSPKTKPKKRSEKDTPVYFVKNDAPFAESDQRSLKEHIPHVVLVSIDELDSQHSTHATTRPALQETSTKPSQKEELGISRLKQVSPPTIVDPSLNTDKGQSQDVKKDEAFVQEDINGQLKELVKLAHPDEIAIIQVSNKTPGNTVPDSTRQQVNDNFGHLSIGVPSKERYLSVFNDEPALRKNIPLAITMSVPKLKGPIRHKERSSVKPLLYPKPRSLQKKK